MSKIEISCTAEQFKTAFDEAAQRVLANGYLIRKANDGLDWAKKDLNNAIYTEGLTMLGVLMQEDNA